MDKESGGFCESPLWDEYATWNTTDPDFTPCFQKTVLLWMPSALLVIGAPFRFYYLTRNRTESIPFTLLNILKTVLAVVIALLAVADIIKTIQEYATGQSVPTVNFISPLVLCLTMVLVIVLIHHERKQGVHSSGFLFLFWLLLVCDSIVIFQSKVRAAVSEGGISDIFRFVTFFMFFPLVLTEVILSAFVDKNPAFLQIQQDNKPCPENSSSFPSRITFWWFSSLVIQGYKRALVRGDLWELNNEDRSSTVVPQFEKHWECEVEKCKKRRSKRCQDTPPVDSAEMKTRHQDGQMYSEVQVTDGKKTHQASLFKSMVKTYAAMFLLSAAFKLVFDIMQFIAPILLKLLIQYTKDKTEYYWRGFFYAVLMFLNAALQSLILHQYFHGCQLVGMRMRTAIIASVYNKTLKLSNAARKSSTVGEIVNLMSVDAQRFMDLMTYLHMIWSGPFQIIVSIYLLWNTLGYSIMAGVGIMVVLIPINAAIAKKTRDYQAKQMRLKDQRIKLMNEILNGMKVLKLYAWEASFEKQVLELRKKELAVLKRLAYLNACVSFTWTTAPYMVSLLTFAVYVLSDSNNILDAEKAFVSLSLFNILRFPLSMLPQVISSLVQANVSLKRLQRFLNNEELDPSAVQHEHVSKHAICMENLTVTWESESLSTLRNINLQIPEGSLVAIVGAVGAGKSSILSAMLGEMEKISGSVNIKGSVAYVAQQAWIQNATLQNNILFGRSVNQKEYNGVVEGCALAPDLEILPAGDQTEIGEKLYSNIELSQGGRQDPSWISCLVLYGEISNRRLKNLLSEVGQRQHGKLCLWGINLSGGQKQRVSLARAVYQDADIYLLDDPLSAVDSHVGKHIFDNVIGPDGLLKDKTRVLVTHGISYLPKVDLIVVLVDGQISEYGSYKELLGHAGAFAEFLRNYLTEELENEDIEAGLDDIGVAEDLVSQLSSVMADDKAKKLQKQLVEKQVSVISSRLRTMSGGSHENLAHETGSVVSLTKSVGSNGPGTPVLKQKSDHSHHNKEEGAAESVIKQVEEKKKEDKLIQAESVETGSVKYTVFLSYLKSVGPVLSPLIMLFYVLYNVASVYSNFWLSAWSNDNMEAVNGTHDTAKRDLRLGVYGVLGLVQGTIIIVATVALYKGNVIAGRRIHRKLLHNILSSPMVFFDTTPSGRLINRFGKDIDMIDTVLPRVAKKCWDGLLCVISVPIVIGYGTPLFLSAIPPLFIFYVTVQCNIFFAPGFFLLIAGIILGLGSVIAARVFHLNLLYNILRSPMLLFETTPTGRILNRFSSDVDSIDLKVPECSRKVLLVLLSVISTFILIVIVTPLSATAIIPLLILYGLVQRFYVATSRQLKRLESVSRSPIYSHFGETITGVSTIRAYQQQKRFITESEYKVDENLICHFPAIIANRWLAIRLEFVGNCIVFFAALFAVIGRDSLSPGIVGLSITYALNVTQTLNWLVRMTTELETNIVAVERVKEYSETPTEAAWVVDDNRPDQKWPDAGRVVFDDYGIRYREGLDLVLKGISCTIEPGEKIGIVGRTGAGKSSLTMALFRIVEKAQGSITIDGIDVSSIGLHDLRSKITIIPQEPVLFSGTLRMNLDPFTAYTDADLWKALDHAHLKNFVSGLPKSLLHECTEGGENLSVGQRQLVCLARALLRKTKILVLDEATAAVDLETDDLIQHTIRTEFADSTILTIAHRLNTIMDYTRIMVLDSGKIKEFDSPNNLLQDEKSVFFGMAKDAGLVA